MTSKPSLSRAVLRGTVVALALAAGVASTTLAVAQVGGLGPGEGPGPVEATTPDTLATELAAAQSKAEIVALLNGAAQAGMTKLDIMQALQSAQRNTGNVVMARVLGTIQLMVMVSGSRNGWDGPVSFVDNGSGGATGSIGQAFFFGGNNAVSGGIIDTSGIGGGFDFGPFQSNNIRVGPYTA